MVWIIDKKNHEQRRIIDEMMNKHNKLEEELKWLSVNTVYLPRKNSLTFWDATVFFSLGLTFILCSKSVQLYKPLKNLYWFNFRRHNREPHWMLWKRNSRQLQMSEKQLEPNLTIFKHTTEPFWTWLVSFEDDCRIWKIERRDFARWSCNLWEISFK